MWNVNCSITYFNFIVLSDLTFDLCLLQTQLEIQRALEADPTVYEYDSVYDDMERKKEEKLIAIKKQKEGSKVYI